MHDASEGSESMFCIYVSESQRMLCIVKECYALLHLLLCVEFEV